MELSKQQKIEAVFAGPVGSWAEQAKRHNRAADWGIARKAALLPRQFETQSYLGELYFHPLVFKAHNQSVVSDWRRFCAVKTGMIYDTGYLGSMTPAEEITVCRMLIRLYARKLKRAKNRPSIHQRGDIALYRRCIMAELIRLGEAKSNAAMQVAA